MQRFGQDSESNNGSHSQHTNTYHGRSLFCFMSVLCMFCLGKYSGVSSLTTKQVTDGCHTQSTFLRTSQSNQEIVPLLIDEDDSMKQYFFLSV